MKSLKLLILLVSLIFSGCTQNINKKEIAPENLIPKDQMIDILVDLRLMDAVLTSVQRKKDPHLQDSVNFYYSSVMEKYGITREKFDSSLAYYQRDLKELDKLYEEAITRLSKMKTEETQKQQ